LRREALDDVPERGGWMVVAASGGRGGGRIAGQDIRRCDELSPEQVLDMTRRFWC